MFEKCYKCGQGGLKCQDDYASLKSGHWWEWRNVTHKMLPGVKFLYLIPIPYKCPTQESCKGDLDSPCADGYEGPLCAVCSSGYYKQLQECKKCSTKKWMLAQLSIIAAIVLIITVVLVRTGKRKTEKEGGQPLIDVLLIKLKIVLGFYQVTYGLLQTFSYIKWPGSLQVIAKYSGILQMGVLQVAPIYCLFPGLKVDAFGSLFALMLLNSFVIGFSAVAYGIRKVIILRDQNTEDTEKLRTSQRRKNSCTEMCFSTCS